MWIFTPNGYLSVVGDRDTPGHLLVRSRFKGDIEAHFPRALVSETPAADYRYRASVPVLDVEQAMVDAVHKAQRYDNFKKACPHDRQAPYLSCWAVLSREQDRRHGVRPLAGQHSLDFGDFGEPDEVENLKAPAGFAGDDDWDEEATLRHGFDVGSPKE